MLLYPTALFCGKVGYQLSVGSQHAGAKDVALQAVVDVDDGKGFCIGSVKLMHDILHGLVAIEDGRYGSHQLRYTELLIEFWSEDDMANLVDIYLAHQSAGSVYYRQKVVVGTGENVYKFAQEHVGLHGDVVFLYE